MKKIPKLEVGGWARCEDRPATDPGPEPFGDAVIVDDEIRLSRDGQTVTRTIEQAPPEPWGSPCRQALVFCGDGRWLWHLGYKDGLAKVNLLDGITLETVDAHTPMTRDLQRNREEAVLSWCELSADPQPCADPHVMLAFANAGDSFELLLTLQATPHGIVDPVGMRLFDAVADQLDAVLWSASFLSPDRLLAIDDVGNLTLFAWPRSEKVAAISVLSGLRNDDHEVKIWPDDADEDLWVVVGEQVGEVGRTLLVNVYENDDPFVLRALVALDKEIPRSTPEGEHKDGYTGCAVQRPRGARAGAHARAAGVLQVQRRGALLRSRPPARTPWVADRGTLPVTDSGRRCPSCGSGRVLPIVYSELPADPEFGKRYVAGGCCVGPEQWCCLDCEAGWT